MGSPKGTTNNADHESNLRHFNSETARAAAAKSAETRRRNKQEKAVAQAVMKREVGEWVATYQREDLGPLCAAAAQKVAHMILNGEIKDERALIQALPVLVDITRIEGGEHTTATMHAHLSMVADPMERIAALRAKAQANLGVLDVVVPPPPPA
jgi:hypothetical protein